MVVVGILLAAGRGQRFDPSGASNKLLAPLPSGAPVVLASARTLLSVLPRVIAVVAPGAIAVASALRGAGCEVVVCEDASQGMSASLKHALRSALPEVQAWIVALGDMPHVQASTIGALHERLLAGEQIVVPVHGGRRGNPVGFGASSLPLLLALEGDQGARAIVRAGAACTVDVNDAGIFHDIDTPSDLHDGTLPVGGQVNPS